MEPETLQLQEQTQEKHLANAAPTEMGTLRKKLLSQQLMVDLQAWIDARPGFKGGLSWKELHQALWACFAEEDQPWEAQMLSSNQT